MLRIYQTTILIIFTFLSAYAKQIQTDGLVTMYSVEELHQDLEYLHTSLIKYHPNLFTYQSKESFEKGFQTVREEINKPLTENEFYRLVKPLVSAIKCGHTELYFSDKYQSHHIPNSYPIDVFVRENEIFVRQSNTAQLPVGSKIVSINQIAASDIINKLKVYISSDGTHQNGREYWLSRNFFKLFEEILAESPALQVVYEYNQTQKKVRLQPSTQQYDQHNLYEPLLSLQYDPNSEVKTATLDISSFDKRMLKQTGYNYNKFLKKVFEKIQEKDVDKLIIDLRDNYGGNDINAIELYSYISDKPFKFYEKLSLKKGSKRFLKFPYKLFFPLKKDTETQMMVYNGHKGLKFLSPKKTAYTGELEVLINGGTMSAATHFAAKCDNSGRAVLAGSTSGGAYTHSNSGFTIYRKTPNTGLQLFIPAIKYDLFLPNKIQEESGIQPDIIIDEFILGEKTAKLIKSGS